MINVLFSVANVLDTSAVTTTALVGEFSSFKITGRGGQPPYLWIVTPPAGSGTLSEMVSGPDLTVGFTPSSAGTLTFVVRITDARRVTKTRTVTVEVVDPFASLVLGNEDGFVIGIDDPFIANGIIGVDGVIVPPT